MLLNFPEDCLSSERNRQPNERLAIPKLKHMCDMNESAENLLKQHHLVKHGECRNNTYSAEYSAWRGMKSRCNLVSHDNYYLYGGRGIKVCERWEHSFENFLLDMGRKPSPEHTVGRIDSNGNYEPSNCRWETSGEQQNNKRNNRRIELDGINLTFAQWERKMNLTQRIISKRKINGWSDFDAVMTPMTLNKQRFNK